MMEYLLSLSQDLLKVFLTIVVTAYANKFANTLFKKSKRATPRRRKQGSSKRKQIATLPSDGKVTVRDVTASLLLFYAIQISVILNI
ncbi:hypothetical protein P5765_23875 [Bacillus cereus]|nr:hypothetical protein [Bacillus cereus]MBL3890796.1 hypothetical protein [Bacillus cereus]MDF9654962.1 hypothetical protein [Bacillus cereus]